jgi:Na+/glutamate symporter
MGREIQGERIDEVPGGRLKIGPWEFHLNAEAEPSVEALRTMEEEVAAAAQTVGLTMGVLLGGQVQCGVSRIQIGKSPLAVADTAHHDLTEDRGQAPVPTRLRPAAGHTVSIDDLAQALLTLRA